MKEKRYTVSELSNMVSEFLQSLDDSEKDSFYLTHRELCTHGAGDFIDWLKERNSNGQPTKRP